MKYKKDLFVKFSIYMLALRSPILILTIVAYLLSDLKSMVKMIRYTLPFIIFILIEVIYSISNGNDLANIIGQSRDILLAIIVFAFLLSSSFTSMSVNYNIYKSLRNVFVFIGVVKILVIIFAAVTGTQVSDIISWFRDTWNIQMMSLGVQDSIFFRLQIPLDSAVPFMIYFVLQEIFKKKFEKKLLYLYLFILLISMLLTLSRAFWAETILMLGLCYIFEADSKRKLKTFIATFVSLSFLYFLTPVGDSINRVIESRFGSSANVNNVASDHERLIQNLSLSNAFFDSPILGHGLGYYVPNMIRSVDTKYLYESQTLSMLMDIGVLGCVVFLLLLLIVIFNQNRSIKSNVNSNFMVLVFIGLWIFSGSVNPLLFGASGGTILFMIANFNRMTKNNSEGQ